MRICSPISPGARTAWPKQPGVRAAELGLEVVELPSWYDVDDRAALDRLADERRSAFALR